MSYEAANNSDWLDYLEKIDRRIIYIFLVVSLAIPLILDVSLKPARMETAQSFFNEMEKLEAQPGKLVLVASDWGPGTMAENRPQTELVIEHLLRKRIPFAMISVYVLADPFLRELPLEVAERLSKETGETWEYGKDWVNFGYRPGMSTTLQSLAKAESIADKLSVDANQIPLSELPIMKGVTNKDDISLIIEITGLVGVFNAWIQFFSGPPMLHGCTSVTIPEAFIYYSSNQIRGLFEGVAGAAWYEVLLTERYPSREGTDIAMRVNTGLSFAQIVVVFFIALANIGLLLRRARS